MNRSLMMIQNNYCCESDFFPSELNAALRAGSLSSFKRAKFSRDSFRSRVNKESVPRKILFIVLAEFQKNSVVSLVGTVRMVP